MFCKTCGAQVDPDNEYCPSCGQRRGAAATDPQLPGSAPSLEVPATPAARAPRFTPRMRRVAQLVLAATGGLAVAAAVGFAPMWTESLRQEPAPTESAANLSTPVDSAWFDGAVGAQPGSQERVVTTTLEALADQPDAFADRLVKVSGILGEVQNRGSGTLFGFSDGDYELSAYYPSTLTAADAGDSAVVVGIPSPDGSSLLALAVAPEDVVAVPVTAEWGDLPLLTLIASAAFFLAALLVRLGRIITRRRARLAATTLLLLVLALPMTGCNIDLVTVVEPDGSGTVTTTIYIGSSDMTEIMGLPNAEAFMDSWAAGMEARGMTVTRDEEQITLIRTFDSPADLNAEGGPSQESWTYLRFIDMPDGVHASFLGSIETTSLYAEQGVYDPDGQATNELNNRMSEAVFNYSLSLPGETVSGDGGAWSVTMGSSASMFAESVVDPAEVDAGPDVVEPKWYEPTRERVDLWRAALWWIWGATAGLFVFAVLAHPWRRDTA